MFLFVIKHYVYYSPGGKFFTAFFVKITRKIGTILVLKLVLYPGFINTLSETLRTYTFLVMFFVAGEIKPIMLKVLKIKLL